MLTLFDAPGLLGVAIILVTYFLLQSGKIQAQQLIFSALNMLGAVLILLSLMRAWNLSAALIEIFWIIISLYGVIKSIKKIKHEPSLREHARRK